MSATLSWPDILLRLACGIVAGLLIGLDRGEHAHPAGLRTTVLITVAATVAMIQANWIVAHMTDLHDRSVQLDTMRLPEGILSGVGFLGAGAILRRGGTVRGVTTAATIWFTTAIGLCFGGGQMGLGAIATVIALATLWLMTYAEAAFVTGRRGTIIVCFTAEGPQQAALFSLLAARGFKMRSHGVEFAHDATRVTCSGRYRGAYPEWPAALTHELAARPDVRQVEWRDSD